MKRYVVCLILLIAFLSSDRAYSQCQELVDQRKTHTDVITAATDAKKLAKDNYDSRCARRDKAPHACSVNYFTHVWTSAMPPVQQCSLLYCFVGDAWATIEALTIITEIIGISLKSDARSADCQSYCTDYWAQDDLINSETVTLKGINATEATICSNPCNGKKDLALQECECGRMNADYWTWDPSQLPPACVPCKDKTGDASLKCLCEAEGKFFYPKDKTCYTPACSNKTGTALDICICETEKKLKWDAYRKVCNYVASTPETPGIKTPLSGDGTGADSSDAGAGYAAAGAGVGSSGSSGSPSAFDFGGGLFDSGSSNKKGGSTKRLDQTGSWYQNLLKSMGFVGKGGPGAKEGGSANDEKAMKPYEEKKTIVAPTDISSKTSDDIFAQVAKVYTIRYRSEILRNF